MLHLRGRVRSCLKLNSLISEQMNNAKIEKKNMLWKKKNKNNFRKYAIYFHQSLQKESFKNITMRQQD